MESVNNLSLVVVTGGSRGIGAAIIREFASQGYAVVTYARQEAELKALKDELKEKHGTNLYYLKTDALSTPEIQRFAEYVESLPVKVSVLVNNAGLFLPGTLGEEPEGRMQEMLQLNFNSAYVLTRALLPGMKSRGQGHIFNMCSVASIKEYAHGGSYSVSKAALLSFSRNLREELKTSGIRVTAVLPGATYTDSWASAGLPEERFMPAEDVARLIRTCHELSPRSVVEEILLRPQLGDI